MISWSSLLVLFAGPLAFLVEGLLINNHLVNLASYVDSFKKIYWKKKQLYLRPCNLSATNCIMIHVEVQKFSCFSYLISHKKK